MAEMLGSRGALLARGAAAGLAPEARSGARADGRTTTAEDVAAAQGRAAAPLVVRLCEGLRLAGIAYCQFKSNWRLERWLSGEGDLDLLVEREGAARFAGVVEGLGFKPARPTRDREVPGVCDYYGFDKETGRLVHLHVHHQLALGHDLTKNFRLPIERAYIESASLDDLIPVPAAEFELVLFVLRMVLKHGPAEAAFGLLHGSRRPPDKAIREEMAFLEARSRRDAVEAVLREHLPFVGARFFDECAATLRGECPAWRRWALRRELERRLAAHARRGRAADAALKVGRRVKRFVTERAAGRPARKRLARGGALVALVGGDGAGKTTAVEGLHGWLSKKFVARKFHMGKPPRSPLTLAVIVALRVRDGLPGMKPREGDFPGYLRLLRWVLAARDRRRLYMRARRFATNGGIALCDRFPVERLRLMDGPNIARTVAASRAGRFVRLLLEAEERNYRQIMEPDLLFVLRVEPETAVQRKTVESEEHVRTRSRELWEQDWSGTRAHVVDAG
ncbi:MAG TPA: hypothetical protein VD968_16330, partial [Pyrinomonadaceae bacterium]|nr:hypothetical protein [Pyrinomonadaceae bacterium]